MMFNDAAFFSDFAVQATLNGVSVRGIFDHPASLAMGMVSGENPSFLVASSVSASRGQALLVNARSYQVVAVEPDGTGMTRLQLEEAFAP